MFLCLICRFIHFLVFHMMISCHLVDLHLVISLLLVSLTAVNLLLSNNLVIAIYLPYHNSALSSLSCILNLNLYLPIACLKINTTNFEDRSYG